MDRVILHSDMNCFYASVEMLHHPEFGDRPLAVGGDPLARHGIVLTANYPAKRRGVKTGMALWQARKACPELMFVPPRMDLYLRFSKLAHSIYKDYSDMIEPFGIDESWIDITSSVSALGDGPHIADKISKRIKHELGLTVSIGISYNKIFAKFGSDYKKPDAITHITRDNYTDIVWRSPVGLKENGAHIVGDLLYVGRATERKLRSVGIRTIGDLATASPDYLKGMLGKMGLILWIFANGEDQTPVSEDKEVSQIKSIGNSTTTPRDLTCDDDVSTVLYLLSESVASRLRDNHFVGRNVGISVRDNGLFWFSRQKKIDIPTNISEEIYRYALEIFKANYTWRQPIRSICVRVSDLILDEYCYQLSLFSDPIMREKQLKADIAVDTLRNRFGHESIMRGRMYMDRDLSGLDAKAEDHMVHPHSYFEKGNQVGNEEIYG